MTLKQGALQARRVRDDGSTVGLALVAAHALLLAGDHVRVEVSVAGPVHVHIVETGGTVAYDMRGGAASWTVEIDLADGAKLTWDGQPFIVSAGADVLRRTDAVVEAGCLASLRETIVLGRTEEVGGTLRTRTRIEQASIALLVEDLNLAPESRAGRATLNGHRCLDSLTTIGHRLPEAVDVLQLEGMGSVHRWIGDELHRTRVLLPDQMARLGRDAGCHIP